MAAHLQHTVQGAAAGSSLTLDEARALMAGLLDGPAAEAFAKARRAATPTLDELTGFVQAVQARCLVIPSPAPVVLIPSYSGAGQLPLLTPLLAMSLAQEGLRVLVHGPAADAARAGSAAILADLGLAAAQQVQDIEQAWSRRQPAFVPIALLCPALGAWLDPHAPGDQHGLWPLVARLLNPVRGAAALRLVHHDDAATGALLGAWAQHEAADVQLLRGTEGEPVADPRRLPRIDTWLAGVPRPELSLPAQDGAPTALPLLPGAGDVAGTAVYVQEVLSGSRPAPGPMACQAAILRAAVAALQARSTAPPAGPDPHRCPQRTPQLPQPQERGL